MQIEKYGFYLQSFLRDISKLPITRLFPHEQVPVPTLMNYRDPRILGLAPCVLKHMDIMCTYLYVLAFVPGYLLKCLMYFKTHDMTD
jgi:hypothetical protein